ncbi:Tyrosyl-tRNA synthetase [Hordeum vulgare]|nr:Tyrosyl-tRNA synthetase [Hordeum vulgare]
MIIEPIKEHASEASDAVVSKDNASIFGGEIADVPSSAFIHGDSDDMVEHGILPSSTTTFGDELKDFCEHIASESDFTTIPIYVEFPQFPYKERNNPHHLSETSDSTICDLECNYLEAVGPIHDDTLILDDFILPLDKTMAMVEYNAPPHGSIMMKMTMTWSMPPHLHHMSGLKKVK